MAHDPTAFQIASASQISKTWKSSGGDYGMSFASLAVDAARQGVKGDLGVNYDRVWYAMIQSNMDVAPIAGKELELFIGFSPNSVAGTDNPAGLVGTNSAWKAGEEDEWKWQADFIGVLPLTADADTIIQRKIVGPFIPPFRYVCPLLINKADQILEGDEDSHKIVLYSLAEQGI